MKGILIVSGDTKPKVKKVDLKIPKCKKPSFKNHRGRTWDTGKVLINQQLTTVHLDTTWGDYIYFQDSKAAWYKVRMVSDKPWDKDSDYDIDPFAIEKAEILILDGQFK